MNLRELVDLSRLIAKPEEDCVILAEGNTSAIAEAGSFWIKASGRQMATVDESEFVTVQSQPLLNALETEPLDDAAIEALLFSSLDPFSATGKPSTEAFMHAYLLSLDGVEGVAHTHPTPLLAILCLSEAEELAHKRLFPDEIVCCGPRACWVPYCDPGLPLAKEIRTRVQRYMEVEGVPPKTIWLQNHGLICLGKSPSELLSATRMSVKAARVWLAAIQSGGTIESLSRSQIARIDRRPDEHYRQRMLWS